MSSEIHTRGLEKLKEIVGEKRSRTLEDWKEIAPDMERYIVDFVAGEILSRPGLDAKTRQLVTVAMLGAIVHAPMEFKMHLHGALNLGWSRDEVIEVLIQLSVFAGFPASLTALNAAKEVFAERDSQEGQ